jgi:alpha-mannosidase
MIGNAHIDPVWLWRCEEGCHEVMASYRSALDRMKEDADFTFSASSAAFYAWVEQISPAMFEEIRERVREGRWEIVGGWWVEPDCNIPHGESFVRHGLYSQRYFKDKFGVIARVGYNVDSFGHAASLPQILKKSGMDYYIFMRPSRQEKGLPGLLFWWEGDDGSRVLTYRLPYEYASRPSELDKHIRRCVQELRPPFTDLMCFYGVGNHGGGPTKQNLASIRRLDAEPEMPRLAFSTTEKYFAAVEAQSAALPVVHEEFQHHASGTYAAHSGIKAWNRRAERQLMTAEKFAALAATYTGTAYPREELGRAWRQVLFNQFHDILAGTSLESAYDDARDALGEAMAIAARAQNMATQSLAWNIILPWEEDTVPVVVFNPHAWPSRAVVDMEYGILAEDRALVDDQGAAVPFQRTQSEATVRRRDRLNFIADLPPLGYRVYRVVKRPPDPRGSLAATTTVAPTAVAPEPDAQSGVAPAAGLPADVPFVSAGTNRLESDRFRLLFDPETGYISSLFDKAADVEVFAGPAAVPAVIEDRSDTWSHNVWSFRDVVDRFTVTSMQPVTTGPVKAVMRVVSECGRSRIVQDFTLYAGLDHVDVFVTVDWHEQFKVLKLKFPINVHFHAATSQIPYGHITRETNGEEQPGGAWLDVSGISRISDEPYGVSLLNDSKHSYDVHIREIGLTVLRSPIYAHHDPMIPEPGQLYSYMDQGMHRFRYALYPHTGNWQDAGTVRRSAEVNAGPVALMGNMGPDGFLPLSGSFLEVTPLNVVCAGAEAGRGG